MKKINCVLLLSLMLMLVAGCSKDDSWAPLNQNDQVSSLKKGNVVTEFTGECTPNFLIPDVDGEAVGKQLQKGDIVTWYDNATDPKVTGTTIWYVNKLPKKDGVEKFWGKMVLIIK